MSKTSTLAKLQSLLDRVRARSNMPRNGQVGPAQAAAVAIHAEPPPMLSVASAAAVSIAPDDDEMDLPTLPPPAALDEISVDVDMGEAQAAAPEDSLAASVEESALPPTAVVAPDEAVSPAARESAERLVAAERAGSERPQVDLMFASAPPLTASPAEKAPPVAVAPPPADAESDADASKPPASSRRPVAPEPEEQIAAVAFGSEEPQRPPRHTPPPESGRLPASPVEEFDPDVTGVRTAPQAEKPIREERELAPVATRAQLPSGESIVTIAGTPAPFEPTTFAAWLDATLSL